MLPEIEPIETLSLKEPQLAEELLRSQLEAACNVFYLISIDTESLTGPEAIKRACGQFLGEFNRKLGIREPASADESKHDLKRSGLKKKTKNKEKFDDKNDQIAAKFNGSFDETKENQKANQIHPDINGIVVYFKVASTGISMTDNTHRYAPAFGWLVSDFISFTLRCVTLTLLVSIEWQALLPKALHHSVDQPLWLGPGRSQIHAVWLNEALVGAAFESV